MRTNLPIRILGVFALHAVMGLIFWLFVRFFVTKQESLSPALLERLDGSPARIATYLADISGQLLITGLGALALSAVLASLWLWTIHRNPPIGDASARSKVVPWAVLLLLGLAATAIVFWLTIFNATIGQFLVRDVAINSLIVALTLAALGYWLATALLVPASTVVAVPVARMIRRH